MKIDLSDPSAIAPTMPTDEDFYKRWRPKVIHMAYQQRLIDPEADAEDVLVDFMLSGYIDRWDFTKGRSFDRFCFWMLRNRITSKSRKQKRRTDAELGAGVVGGDHNDLFGDDGYGDEFETVMQQEDLRALATYFDGKPAEVLSAMIALAEAGSPIHDRAVAEVVGWSPTTARHHRLVLADAIERGAGGYFG